MIIQSLSRREFLMTLSGVVGALALSPTEGFAWAESKGVGGELMLPVELGRYYLGLFGQEPEIAALRARVHGSVSSILEQTALIEELKREISDDYLKARDFEYDQWLLSRTEGRLCALAALE